MMLSKFNKQMLKFLRLPFCFTDMKRLLIMCVCVWGGWYSGLKETAYKLYDLKYHFKFYKGFSESIF